MKLLTLKFSKWLPLPWKQQKIDKEVGPICREFFSQKGQFQQVPT